MTVLPKYLLPNAYEFDSVSIAQACQDIKILESYANAQLIDIITKYPQLIESFKRLYQFRNISLNTQPQLFQFVLNQLTPVINPDSFPEGSVGQFLYKQIQICADDLQQYCTDYQFNRMPASWTALPNEIMTKNVSHVTFVIINDDSIHLIPASGSRKANIYIPFTNMNQFPGLSDEQVQRMKDYNIEEVMFLSSTGMRDYKLTDYQSLDSTKRRSNLNNSSNSGTNSSNSGSSSAWFWGLVILVIVIIILIALYFWYRNQKQQ